MPTWVNEDGLGIDFGVDEAQLGRVASYRTDGDERFTEIVVNADQLPAAGTTEVIDWKCSLPKGAIISRVECAPNAETFAGGTSIDVGLVDKDGTSNGDSDALFDGQTLADLNDGDVTAEGTAVNGDALTSAKFLTWTPTGTFTAGITSLRVYWVVPKSDEDSLVYDKTA